MRRDTPFRPDAAVVCTTCLTHEAILTLRESCKGTQSLLPVIWHRDGTTYADKSFVSIGIEVDCLGRASGGWVDADSLGGAHASRPPQRDVIWIARHCEIVPLADGTVFHISTQANHITLRFSKGALPKSLGVLQQSEANQIHQ